MEGARSERPYRQQKQRWTSWVSKAKVWDEGSTPVVDDGFFSAEEWGEEAERQRWDAATRMP